MKTEQIIDLMLENPDIIPTLIPELVNKYKPSIYSIGKELLNIMKDYSDNTEYFKTCANIKRQFFDAYIDVGFSEDQAIAFMINDNLKLMENIKKQSLKVNSTKSK